MGLKKQINNSKERNGRLGKESIKRKRISQRKKYKVMGNYKVEMSFQS